jgi:hypothetical protein
MENLGIFYGHLLYLKPLEICYGHLVYFAVIWYIFLPVLVICTKKNLATLSNPTTATMARSSRLECIRKQTRLFVFL